MRMERVGGLFQILSSQQGETLQTLQPIKTEGSDTLGFCVPLTHYLFISLFSLMFSTAACSLFLIHLLLRCSFSGSVGEHLLRRGCFHKPWRQACLYTAFGVAELSQWLRALYSDGQGWEEKGPSHTLATSPTFPAQPALPGQSGAISQINSRCFIGMGNKC